VKKGVIIGIVVIVIISAISMGIIDYVTSSKLNFLVAQNGSPPDVEIIKIVLGGFLLWSVIVAISTGLFSGWLTAKWEVIRGVEMKKPFLMVPLLVAFFIYIFDLVVIWLIYYVGKATGILGLDNITGIENAGENIDVLLHTSLLNLNWLLVPAEKLGVGNFFIAHSINIFLYFLIFFLILYFPFHKRYAV